MMPMARGLLDRDYNTANMQVATNQPNVFTGGVQRCSVICQCAIADVENCFRICPYTASAVDTIAQCQLRIHAR